MTKSIRIENADTSSHQVLVEVREIDNNGNDILIETAYLLNPTDMINKTIWKNRYLIIRENT